MHILAITPSYHPAVGGVETHVKRLSEQLTRRGHHLEVLTHGAGPSEEVLEGVRIHRLPQTNALHAWRLGRRHIAAADLVHCHDTYSFLHFYLPSCWFPPKRPVFATFHGYEGYPIPAEAVQKRRFVSNRVRNAICMGDFICKWYEVPCFGVSYGAVDTPPTPVPVPAQPTALFLGRLAEDTSLMLYLDALVILHRDYGKRIRLTVAGDGPLRPLAEKYAEAQGLWVKFIGAVEDPRPLLAETSFAFVSGYLAIWEALAYQRLVFALYDNEVKKDYLYGFPSAESILVIRGDAAALAEALNHHLAHPAAGGEMREKGARLAAEHTWERVADLYLAMYRAHGIEV